MSKFINTKRKVTIDSLVEGLKDNLKNPYYLHNDKQPFIVTYYNLDLAASTLDEGTKTEYSALGKDSPFKFNKINNFYLYGIDHIVTSWESGDWGLESDSIEGEAVILPNTIEPIANDYFVINHINKPLLFKVLHVSADTLENGGNFYKISYKLDQLSTDSIEKQVKDEYEMLINNIGTQFKSVIRSTEYKYIDKVDDILDRLKRYYLDLFYSNRVQTFVFHHNGFIMYDPYMIEFLIRNKILKDNDEYIYITHQTTLPNTFSLDYDRTFFRFIEIPEINLKRKPRIYSQARGVDEYLSILSFREEDYMKIEYIDDESITDRYLYILDNFDKEMVNNIFEGKLYEFDDYRNIIIKHCLNKEITKEDIYLLEDIEFDNNIELFYNIPIIIYIINNNIENLLKNK